MAEKNFNCPYCVSNGKETPDTKHHLYVNEEKGVYYCQRCGAKGHLTELEKSFDTLEPIPYIAHKFDNIELVKLMGIQGLYKNAYDVWVYCDRRLGNEVAAKYLWWSPDIPRRAFFVIHEDNKPVMWQGRTIDRDVEPKYLTWGKCSQYVYGIENIKESWGVLCEGPFSALSCPNGLAVFGKRLSVMQGILLASRLDKLYLAVEKGAEKEWEQIENDLTPFLKCVKLDLGDKDANDYGYEEMCEILKEHGEDI